MGRWWSGLEVNNQFEVKDKGHPMKLDQLILCTSVAGQIRRQFDNRSSDRFDLGCNRFEMTELV